MIFPWGGLGADPSNDKYGWLTIVIKSESGICDNLQWHISFVVQIGPFIVYSEKAVMIWLFVPKQPSTEWSASRRLRVSFVYLSEPFKVMYKAVMIGVLNC